MKKISLYRPVVLFKLYIKSQIIQNMILKIDLN